MSQKKKHKKKTWQELCMNIYTWAYKHMNVYIYKVGVWLTGRHELSEHCEKLQGFSVNYYDKNTICVYCKYKINILLKAYDVLYLLFISIVTLLLCSQQDIWLLSDLYMWAASWGNMPYTVCQQLRCRLDCVLIIL